MIAIEDIFVDHAENVSDVEWGRWANDHADAMLTKDKKMRYQESFQTASCPIFALTDGNIALGEVVRRIDRRRVAPGRHPGREPSLTDTVFLLPLALWTVTFAV